MPEISGDELERDRLKHVAKQKQKQRRSASEVLIALGELFARVTLAACEELADERDLNIRLERERGKWRAAFTDATFGYDVHASYEDDAEFADLEDALEWLYERATGAAKEGDE